MYLLNVYSVFKVREVFALTNQLGTFFGNNKENFKKIFSTTFQGQRKPLSHHGDVIGAEYKKSFEKRIFPLSKGITKLDFYT